MRISIIMMLFFILNVSLNIEIQSYDNRDSKGIDMGSSSYRAIIIRQNMKFIENHNQRQDSTYKLEPYSQFIALTSAEAKALYFMKPVPPETLNSFHTKGIKIQVPKIEKKLKAFYVDLSIKFSTPIQNQGKCGNCYAYASTDTVNMINKVAGKNYPLLSAQHLSDCSKGFLNNNGCSGGNYLASFEYQKIFGVYSINAYPQNDSTTQLGLSPPCKTIPGATKYSIKAWYYFAGTSCVSRIVYLAQGYTIAIYVSAGNNNFMYYKSGVLSQCNGSNSLDHAVVLVGAYYDPSNLSQSYLKIKNSWGHAWGESGYIRISLGGQVCMACVVGVFAAF